MGNYAAGAVRCGAVAWYGCSGVVQRRRWRRAESCFQLTAFTSEPRLGAVDAFRGRAGGAVLKLPWGALFAR